MSKKVERTTEKESIE
jgi:hypothetical protein